MAWDIPENDAVDQQHEIEPPDDWADDAAAVERAADGATADPVDVAEQQRPVPPDDPVPEASSRHQ